MARAIVGIGPRKCNGCEECVLSCPTEVLEMIDGKAVATSVANCLACRTCEEICPKGAITVSEIKGHH